MRLHHVEVCITIGDGSRITAVYVWILIGDARTGDAQLIVHADVHARSDVVGKAGARYEIAVLFVEVNALALLKLHLFPGLLVAGSHHRSPFSEVSFPFSVCSQNILGVLVFHAVGWIQCFGLICSHIIVAGIALVGAGDVFGTEVQELCLAERVGEVCLEGMLRATGFALGEQVVELNPRYLTDVIVERIVVDMGRVGAEEIAEDEVVGALLVEESLIVDASIERSVVQILLHLVAVFEALAIDAARHLGKRMTVQLLTEGGQASRGADVAQRIEFVAQTDVTHRERLLHV